MAESKLKIDVRRNKILEQLKLERRKFTAGKTASAGDDDKRCQVTYEHGKNVLKTERNRLSQRHFAFKLKSAGRKLTFCFFHKNALSKIIDIDSVVNFDIADNEVVGRLSGRRVCKNCGQNYHVEFMPPKTEGKCDKCDSELYTRDDDKIEAIGVEKSKKMMKESDLVLFVLNNNEEITEDIKELLKEVKNKNPS